MLSITGLQLRNFRSYDALALDDIGKLTVFVGPNASGKTNAVEAIQLLTALSSFRGATSAELVGRGGDQARAQARIEGDGRVLDIAMSIEQGHRKWFVNGKARQVKDVRGTLPSVAFTPDDLQLVKGSNKERRRELDLLGSQLNANYHQIIRDFEKLLRHKNKLLKDEAPRAMIDAVNDVFAVVGEQYASYREALFDRLMPLAAAHYAHLAGGGATVPSETTTNGSNAADGAIGATGAIDDAAPGISVEAEALGFHYARSWEGPLAATLAARADEEIARHRTLAGPHLDKIELTVDGLDASQFASQGQQRSVVLALKLAEVDLIEEMVGQSPVLLLDDVMSELDSSRRAALVDRLVQGSQTFITTANIDYFDDDMLADARIVELGK